jgi:hypothetical protein
VFTFGDTACDGCKYEYRLFNSDLTKLYRNWSLHSSPLDYKEFLNGGLYHIQVGHTLCADNPCRRAPRCGRSQRGPLVRSPKFLVYVCVSR